MTSIAHGITGAFIATKIGNPLISTPIIIASHFFEDWFPHWDFGTGLSSGKRTKTQAIIFEILELVVLAGLLYWYWQLGNPNLAITAYAGALLAISPDILAAPTTFLDFEPFFLKPFNALHEKFHNSIPHKILGILPQIFIITLIYFLR